MFPRLCSLAIIFYPLSTSFERPTESIEELIEIVVGHWRQCARDVGKHIGTLKFLSLRSNPVDWAVDYELKHDGETGGLEVKTLSIAKPGNDAVWISGAESKVYNWEHGRFEVDFNEWLPFEERVPVHEIPI